MPGEAAELEQLEPERLDSAEHAMQRGLVRDRAAQERVLTSCLSMQGGERASDRGAQVAADQDLVVRRLPLVTSAAGHWVTWGLRGVLARAMLASANRHRAAIRMENASTAAKSPMNPDATPTPTTGMIRPQ